ncbi:MAG: hypothetical protein LBG76_10785 [Treponema sp.]|jgi:hypothetical protein|nr:hypothetical protein [Treponema sp.]
MNSRRIGVFLWLFVAAAGLPTGFPAAADTISVLVVETGLQKNQPEAQFSRNWENEFMDGLFENGHIASNAPILRLEGHPGAELPGEARFELDNAWKGGVDFLVLAVLDYQGFTDMKTPKPPRILIRLFKVAPYQFLYEQQYTGEFPNAGIVAGILVPRLKS